MMKSESLPTGHVFPKPAVAWYIVAVLFILYWLSLLDRLLISLLVAPIRRDLGISDFELSLLQGFAFGLFYAVCGLPLGWLVDRFSRRWVIFAGATVWTVATALCGVAQNYWQLFLARVGVGAGEAALSPAAYSLLADSFEPHRLTTAMTVYSMGSLFGTGMAYLLGGLIVGLVAEHESVLLPILGEVRSWQLVFLVVGLPGILIGLLVFTFKEPARQLRLAPVALEQHPAGAMREVFAHMREHWQFFLCHHAGFTIACMAVTGLALWAPAYLTRSFAWKPAEIGLWLGVVGTASGFIGALLAGQWVDRCYARGQHDAHMRWYAISCLISCPIVVAGVLWDNPWVFLAAFACAQILVSPIMGIAAAALQIASPAHLRGRLSSIYLFIMILLGIGLGPTLVAAFTDFIFQDDAKLGYSLALLFAIACPVASIILLAGMKSMRRVLDGMR
ncbi:MFS transporter [Pseudomonas sp. NFACC07-1]|uniref:spinster family MFS transporter n=1 Tax=Pseudomonas sp. NFACC07-1 TaxID=1566239 RepID=UPI0008D1A2CB|nr:MFS transporter [Pseudomonas sp. NFACC07-1]SEI51436.1 Major Facilitator Superfamily protein [Pseudomonas sp. NFACC07-1]